MHKRPVQPTRRWKVDDSSDDSKHNKENCPNRAVLDPNHLPQPMTYRPLGRKRKEKENADDADAKAVPPKTEEKPAD